MTDIQIAAVAGEHLVAHKVAMLGLIPTLLGQRIRSVDLLVSSPLGDKTIAVQIKSTFHAVRDNTTAPNEPPEIALRFPLSRRAVTSSPETAIYCFIDLKQPAPSAIPDVYVVPATVVRADFANAPYRRYSQLHYERPWRAMQEFRNNWDLLLETLNAQPDQRLSPPEPARMLSSDYDVRWASPMTQAGRMVAIEFPH